MKIAYSIASVAGGSLMALAVAAGALAQEAPTYVRLVDHPSGYYHTTVDKEMFVNQSARNSRKILVGKICSGTSDESLKDNLKEFDAWFKGYYYPLMTDPSELPNLSKHRRVLMRDFFGKIKNDATGLAVREHLNNLTLEFLQKMAAVNAHPAVRYNAMLIIGDLDDRAGETQGGAKPAEPMTKAFDVLQTELGSPTQIDAVRVAALLGLRRHAQLNRARPAAKQWLEPQVAGLAAKVGPLAAAKKPPQGRSLEGHIWMRRLALETLAELGAARPLPAVTTLVDRIVADEAEPMELRIAAAQAQGMLQNPLPMGVKAGGAADKIARVGMAALIADLDGLKHHIDRLEREELTNPRGFDSTGFSGAGVNILGGDGDGDTTSKPENVPVIRDPIVATAQRRMKTRLERIRQGLVGETGAAGLAAVGDKAAIDKYVAAITAIQQSLDKAPLGDPVVLDELKTFYDDLATKGEALEDLLPVAAKPTVEEPSEPEGPVTEGPTVEEPATKDGPAADGPATDGPAAEPAKPAAK